MIYAELGLQFRWSVEYPDVPLWMRVSEYLTEMHMPGDRGLAYRGHGTPITDGEKEYIANNMEKNCFELAKELDRSVQSMRRWKSRISESGYPVVSGNLTA